MIIASIYYIILGHTIEYSCDTTFFLWQTLFIFISLFFTVFEILFRVLIDKENKKINTSFQVGKENTTSTSVRDTVIAKNKDIIYSLVKKATLIHPIGLMIFFLSIIQFIGSILLMICYRFDEYDNCDEKLKKLLFYYSLFIIICGIPTIFCVLFTLISKGPSYFKDIIEEYESQPLNFEEEAEEHKSQ